MLQQIGIDQSKYSGHSFRIGAATTLTIKTLGCWESVAYQLYVTTPREQLVTVTITLAGASGYT